MDPIKPVKTSIGVIFLVLFLDLVGFSIVFPLYANILAFYGHEPDGMLSHALAWLQQAYPSTTPIQRDALFGGLLGGMYSLLQFIAAPLWGRWSDRVGRRPVLLLCVAGNLISYLIWFVADSFAVLLVARILAGAMAGNVAAATAAVADSRPDPKERSRAMGFVGMAFALGFILGPVIGAVSHAAVLRLDGIAALRQLGVNEFSTPALVAAVLSLINLVWAWRRFSETLPPERRRTAVGGGERTLNPLRLFTAAGLAPGVVRVNAAFLLHTVLFAGFETTMVFLTSEFLGYQPGQNGGMFVWMGFVSAVIQGGVYRRLVTKYGPRPLVVAGFLCLLPGFLILATVTRWPSTALLAAGIGVLGAGTGLVFPGLNALVSLATDARDQGLALGTFRSAGSLGRAIGPLVAAACYFLISPAAPYWVGAAGIVLPLLIILWLRPFTQAAETVPVDA